MSVSTLLPSVTGLAYELRLFGVQSNIERRSTEALASSQHPLEYLRLILEDEKLARQQNTEKRLNTRAKFRQQVTLEEWDHAHERGLSKVQFREVASLSFFDHKENLILVGPTGNGKTHLAIALGKKFCAQGVEVHFYSVNLMFEECRAEKSAGKYLQFIRRIKQTPVIILDDFGLRTYTHEEATVLMDMLEERYRNGSVIVTSQVDPKGWRSLFSDPVIAEAITDRLTKPSRQLTFSGPTYRDKLKERIVVEKESKNR
jgi:DNA replication protein DnaC